MRKKIVKRKKSNLSHSDSEDSYNHGEEVDKNTAEVKKNVIDGDEECKEEERVSRTSQWSKQEHPSGWQTDQEARGDKTGMYRATWNLQHFFWQRRGRSVAGISLSLSP